MKIPFPQDNLVFSQQQYSSQFLNSLFQKYQKKPQPFIGVLVVHDRSRDLLLFILQGEPYAAAVLAEGLIEPVDLSDFFTTLVTLKQPLLSLYSIDPVFFKTLLVFCQKRSSTHATTELIDLERLLKELEDEKKEVVLGLRQVEGINLFYLRDGKLVETYYLVPDAVSKEGSLIEQLLVYTYTAASKKPLEVLVYRDVQVSAARDMAPATAFLSLGVVEYFLVAKPELVVSSEEGVLRTMLIEKGRISIGRGPQNDLVIEDASASREHAVIIRKENRFVLEDLASLNGTFLNGKRVSQETLKEGDRLQIGKHTILFLEKRQSLAKEGKESALFEETTQLRIQIPSRDSPVAKPVGKSLSLKVIEGDQVGKIFEVTKEKIFLGRLNSDVILSDPAVSRQHAAIERHEDEFLFHDLKSRNGSYINGERVESKILVGDDAIKIGRTVLKVFIR